eukprot:3172687-Rhodomonas_salina.2
MFGAQETRRAGKVKETPDGMLFEDEKDEIRHRCELKDADAIRSTAAFSARRASAWWPALTRRAWCARGPAARRETGCGRSGSSASHGSSSTSCSRHRSVCSPHLLLLPAVWVFSRVSGAWPSRWQTSWGYTCMAQCSHSRRADVEGGWP